MTLPADDVTRPTVPRSASEPTRNGFDPSTDVTVPSGSSWPQTGGSTGDLTGHVWGDFLVGPLLGRGGMGAVYRGRQRSLDRDVAIKVLPPHLSDNAGFRNRFQLEAKAVASLDSPHIIKVYGAGEADGHHYFAMEYVEGDDLAVTTRNQGRPARAQALDWVLQAARGLQAAGELGIVHRDIKPANMMLTKRGVVKLMDFGLVRSTKETHGLTMTGTVMGTVSYFSPEQGRGDRCDSRTDLYALGVVLYEFLTGRLPFTGEDPTSIIYQHIHVAPIPPKEVDQSIPEDWQAVCLKCLQKNADDRYQAAADLVTDLERLQRGLKPDISASELARLRHGTTLHLPSARRRPLASWILGGTAVAIAGAVAVWLVRQREVPAPPARAEAPTTVATAAATPLGAAPVAAVATTGIAATSSPVPPTRAPEPVPEPASAPLPASSLATAVQALVAWQRFAEARAMVDQERAVHSEAPGLNAITRSIEAAEGATLVAQARTALAAGDLPGAGPLIEAATARLGRTAETIALAQDWDGRRAHLAALLAAARASAAAGRDDDARTALEQAAKEAPGNPLIGEARAAVQAETAHQQGIRASRDDALARGRQALAADDLDAADTAFAAALRADPGHVPALDGQAAVGRKRSQVAELGKRVADAAAGNELPAAERALELLAAAAPRHPATAQARTAVEVLRARVAEERRKADALEAQRAADAKALLAATADATVPVATLEQRLAAFLADAGAQRPERAAIEAGIEDRRHREAIIASLAALDQAVASADRAAIARLVTDADHAAALGSLAGQQGLVFASTLGDLHRDGDRAAATVRIRTALPSFPETVLTYAYDLRRTPSGWVVTAAKRNE